MPTGMNAGAIVHVDTSQELTNSAANLVVEDTNDYSASRAEIVKGEGQIKNGYRSVQGASKMEQAQTSVDTTAMDDTQTYTNRKTHGSNIINDPNVSYGVSPTISVNKSGLHTRKHPIMESAATGSMMNSSRWASTSAQMSPRLQELKRIKKQRYLKLDAIQQMYESQHKAGN